MSDLERRLHHAARELRSIDIEPPPLATIAPSRASARTVSDSIFTPVASRGPIMSIIASMIDGTPAITNTLPI